MSRPKWARLAAGALLLLVGGAVVAASWPDWRAPVVVAGTLAVVALRGAPTDEPE